MKSAVIFLAILQGAFLTNADSGPDGAFGLVFRNLLSYTPSSLVRLLIDVDCDKRTMPLGVASGCL